MQVDTASCSLLQTASNEVELIWGRTVLENEAKRYQCQTSRAASMLRRRRSASVPVTAPPPRAAAAFFSTRAPALGGLVATRK
jgi:hypothetical protein